MIEDDDPLRSDLETALQDAGYAVRVEADGSALTEILGSFRPDLALLDIYLGRGPNGYAIARTVRWASDIPILFITAADSAAVRLAAFEAGGDDVVGKPFSTAELLAQVRALLRRAGRLSSPVVQVGDLLIDDAARTVVRASTTIELTPTEYAIVHVLARHAGQVVSKAALLAQVWGPDIVDTNRVEVQLCGLRQKLEAHGPRLVHTVRAVGYVLRPQAS